MAHSIKMSSRSGNVIGANDLLDSLALMSWFKFNKFLSSAEKLAAEDAIQGLEIQHSATFWRNTFQHQGKDV